MKLANDLYHVKYKVEINTEYCKIQEFNLKSM